MLQKSAIFHKVAFFSVLIPGGPDVGVGIQGVTWAGPWRVPSALLFFGWLRDSPSFILQPYNKKEGSSPCVAVGEGEFPPKTPISLLVTYKPFGTLIYCVPSPRPQPHGHVCSSQYNMTARPAPPGPWGSTSTQPTRPGGPRRRKGPTKN